MSDVDEILASGQYGDRRGRRWEHQASLSWDEVAGFYRTEEIGWCRMRGLSLVGEIITHDQMRLLIERDQHRDVCLGMWECHDHPAPRVAVIESDYGSFAPNSRIYDQHDTLAEAMDAARALAVTS
ncbi:hypothetical protein [Brevibacterium zhoupengii]|uniref:hypothetical protein n=1 Tax=Brevibacterium zhoupengii TaxID=2898795 RepID=UPI001F098346|nr:hypothetical protein [Brevibacterium zhoupengii]